MRDDRIALALMGVVVVIGGVLLVMWSEPVEMGSLLQTGFRFILVVVLARVLLLLVRLARESGPVGSARRRRTIGVARLAWALSAFLVVCWAFRLPLKARFAASRSAFEAAIREVPTGTTKSGFEHWIGAYPVKRIEALSTPSGVRLVYVVVNDDELEGTEGFVYSPEVAQPRRNMGHGWYLERQDP